MNGWHILTSEYPPDVGGVSDYTATLAEALVRAGEEVHVWCPPAVGHRPASGVRVHPEAGKYRHADLARLAAALDSFPAPRRLLVQWVPHGYGYRAMNVWFCLWLAQRAWQGDRVELMVHEPFLELKPRPVRHVPMAIAHRAMTIVLMGSAAKVWVAIPAWERRLRPYAMGRRVAIEWLPIPACIRAGDGPGPSPEPPPESNVAVRIRYGTRGPVVGHFGSYGPDVARLLEERLPAIMDSGAEPSLLLVGAQGGRVRDALVAKRPGWRSRVHATGYLPPGELEACLQACDVMVLPYPDGISSRRTSAMACLALGVPVVTTSGHLTEPMWKESGAVALAPLTDVDGFAVTAVRLLEQLPARQRLRQRAYRVYHDRFRMERIVDTLLSKDRDSTGLPSCA